MPEESVKRYAKGEARRRELLEATVDLIYEEGISAVTHRSVAQRAGVRPSAPSYFFPSIDELIGEAIRSIVATMMESLEALSTRIESEDMTREEAVDAYIELFVEQAPRYDKILLESYLFATRRPALRGDIEAAIAATHRKSSTLVTASRRENFDWAAPILTAYADGVVLQRLATPPDGIGTTALREGLLALMQALPDRGRSAS